MITAVSLFAGIGGFDLALERNGFNVCAAVEIDKDCRNNVLSKHFPFAYTSLFTDVREIKGEQLIEFTGFEPANGIITAGWPCQGNSVAGVRAGMADPRSGLWMEVVRLLSETHPRWFLGENVPGLLTVRGGRDFLAVVRSLDELGYGVAWRVLDAQYFGVPQRRKRVLIVGCLGDPAGAAQVLFDIEGSYGDSAPGPQPGARIAGTLAASAGSGGLGGLGQSNNALTSRIVETVSTLQGGGKRGYRIDAECAAGGHLVPTCVTGDATHSLTTANNGKNSSEDGTGRGVPIVTADPAYALSAHHGHDDRENNYVVTKPRLGVRRLTPLECERLQGFPDNWTAGQSDSARYRQLGNAVAVPVAEWVTRRIAEYDSTSNRNGGSPNG